MCIGLNSARIQSKFIIINLKFFTHIGTVYLLFAACYWPYFPSFYWNIVIRKCK